MKNLVSRMPGWLAFMWGLFTGAVVSQAGPCPFPLILIMAVVASFLTALYLETIR